MHKIKNPQLFILILIVSFLTVSCVSFNTKTYKLVRPAFKSAFKNDTLFNNSQVSLLPLEVKAFNFFNDDEIKYIMNKKLIFSLHSIPGLVVISGQEKSRFTIRPELIIKSYESNYTEKNFYMLSLTILDGSCECAEVRCQYNGLLSIFDARVQDRM